MTQKEALKLVKEKIKNKNLIKHCLAVEACMRALARYFNFSEEPKMEEDKWGIAGLLHDIDYEETKNNPEKHSLIGAEMLEKMGVEKEICEAIKTHNEMHNIAPETKMAKALFSVDPLTGLIIASTLVLPEKKLSNLTTENVLHRFKTKRFAQGANREIISKCSDIDLTLEEFIEICLKAMQGIASDLGL